jgi:lipopolysaccharide export system protein LptA
MRIAPSLSLFISAFALASFLIPVGYGPGAQVLKGHDTTAPVDFSADRIEVQDRADRVVVTGNVQVKQGGLTLTAQRLTVAYHDAGGVEIDRLDATGGVVVTRGAERASGDVAIYDLNQRLITLVGNVSLRQGESNALAGNRLIIDLASGRSSVDGATGTSTGPDGVTQSSSGRVSGRFKVRTPNGN